MPRRRTMTEYRDIIRRLRMGMGPREIQRDTGIHRTIIRGLREIAEVEGWLEPEVSLPSEEEIQRVREGTRIKKRLPPSSVPLPGRVPPVGKGRLYVRGDASTDQGPLRLLGADGEAVRAEVSGLSAEACHGSPHVARAGHGSGLRLPGNHL